MDTVERGEMVEKELNAFVGKLDKQRRKAEGERPKEESYAQNCREHNAASREQRLWDEVRYHEGMIRSHTATFEHLLDGHRRGLERALAMLGIDDGEEAA